MQELDNQLDKIKANNLKKDKLWAQIEELEYTVGSLDDSNADIQIEIIEKYGEIKNNIGYLPNKIIKTIEEHNLFSSHAFSSVKEMEEK